MKVITSLSLAAIALLAMSTTSASAQVSRCERGFYAHARANFDYPYDTRSDARSRAIGIWKTKVRTLCPEHSAFWWRAADKRIDCVNYTGGIVCDIYGRPAHKIFR